MRRNLSRLALKATGGFLLALAVWLGFSEPYTRLLASLSEMAVRVTESPAVTSIRPFGTMLVVDRSDFPASASTMQLAVESTEVTFNFILLTTLFAASVRVFSDRNVFGFAAAAVALLFVHVAAVMAFVKAEYANSFGAWSEQHYGVVARKFWTGAPYFYSIVGVHAFAFALWWLFRPTGEEAAPRRRAAGGRSAKTHV